MNKFLAGEDGLNKKQCLNSTVLETDFHNTSQVWQVSLKSYSPSVVIVTILI